MLPVSRVPFSSYSASSYNASAMPWATPPITWPSTTIGLMMVPQSSTATYLSIRVDPVSGSTSTTQMWVPDGKVQLGGSKAALASSTGSTPSGRLWAAQDEKASSGTVLARSGACSTSTSSGVTPRASATICEKVVLCPWPWGEVPLMTVTFPVGLQRTEARSQPPPAYWSVASTWDGAQPQTSM